MFIALGDVHLFRKQNGATLFDKVGQYDLMKCSECGVEGKCRDMVNVEFERVSKKVQFCNVKPKEINRQVNEAQYNQGSKTKLKCPDCKGALVEIALYQEEDTENYFAEVFCKCGHKKLIDVSQRERRKNKIKKKKPLFTKKFNDRRKT